jgi:hypothetical protein
MSVDQFVFFLKGFSAFSALLLIITSAQQLLRGTHHYTETLVFSLNFIFSVVVIATEFSPFLFENYVIDVFPFLKQRYGKPLFYMVVGSFMLDPRLQFLANVTGYAIMICGVLWYFVAIGRDEKF